MTYTEQLCRLIEDYLRNHEGNHFTLLRAAARRMREQDRMMTILMKCADITIRIINQAQQGDVDAGEIKKSLNELDNLYAEAIEIEAIANAAREVV